MDRRIGVKLYIYDLYYVLYEDHVSCMDVHKDRDFECVSSDIADAHICLRGV